MPPGFTAARRRWLPALTALAVLALALAWWRPWRGGIPAQPRPQPPVPTAAPTPTSTPERIALPPATPRTPTPTPLPTATAAASPLGPRASGTILYIGSIDGRYGIVAVGADGAGARVIAEGRYSALAWSPSGDRFAALGALEGDNAVQLAIFTPDGRPLARYPFKGQPGSDLRWSPDGGKLAFVLMPQGTGLFGERNTLELWLIDGDGPRRIVPEIDRAYPVAWVPDGRLIFVRYATDPADNAIWLADTADGSRRQLARGYIYPLGLAHNGATLICVMGNATAVTSVIALDIGSGLLRPLADADDLAARTAGTPGLRRNYQFTNGALAPGGTILALVVAPGPGPGTPQPRDLPVEQTPVMLMPSGAITGVVALPEGLRPGRFFWSPNGLLLAYSTFASTNSGYGLRVVDTGGIERFRLASYLADSPVAWSPDTNWLVYSSTTGLSIVRADGSGGYTMAPGGTSPAWRPARP